MIPEWMPSIHPLIIHFPIALLIIGFVLDLAGVTIKKSSWMPSAASLIYILGAISLAAAYITGRQAGDAAVVPSVAHRTLSHHADLALYTLWYFGAYGFIRLAQFFVQLKSKTLVAWILLVVGAAGLGLVFETAEHGGELVYRHGVGVRAADDLRSELEQVKAESEILSQSGVIREQNGSWRWNAQKGAEVVVKKQFSFLLGDPETLNLRTAAEALSGEALVLEPPKTPVLFVAGGALAAVQAEAQLNLDDFKGTVMLVHHLQDARNYDFVSLEEGAMKLGRVTDGHAEVDDQEAAPVKGWVTVRAVGSGSHFRGYLGDKLLAHGHDSPLPAGMVGLYLFGEGKVLLEKIAAESLE